MLGLHSTTVEDVCRYFARARDRQRGRPMWRTSHGSGRSLGWIPFKSGVAVQLDKGGVTYLGHRYRLWMHRPVGGRVLCGSFCQDTRRRWYLNLQCEVAEQMDCGTGSVALDLGLSTLATTSDGEKIENPRYFVRHAMALATSQRAGRKERARALYAKIQNARRHWLHCVSRNLVRRYGTIVVGKINSPMLVRTRLATSVLDAGWGTLRDFLRYKAIRHGAKYIEVSERFSTQRCSECSALGGPQGIAALGVRDWQCGECGAHHDRDINAARNLLSSSGQSVDLQMTGTVGSKANADTSAVDVARDWPISP